MPHFHSLPGPAWKLPRNPPPHFHVNCSNRFLKPFRGKGELETLWDQDRAEDWAAGFISGASAAGDFSTRPPGLSIFQGEGHFIQMQTLPEPPNLSVELPGLNYTLIKLILKHEGQGQEVGEEGVARSLLTRASRCPLPCNLIFRV